MLGCERFVQGKRGLTACIPRPRPAPTIIWYPIHFPVDVPGDNVDRRPLEIATRAEPTILNGR